MKIYPDTQAYTKEQHIQHHKENVCKIEYTPEVGITFIAVVVIAISFVLIDVYFTKIKKKKAFYDKV